MFQLDVTSMTSTDAFFGDEDGDGFGASIVPISGAAGDPNGQQGPSPFELVVGAPGHGRAYGMDIHGIRTTTFDGAGAVGFGSVIADARAFFPGGVLIGAPDVMNGDGAVGLYDANGAAKWILYGEPGARLGASLVGPVDYNGLGVATAMVGAPGEKNGGGVVFALDAAGERAQVAHGGAGAELGAALASPGDVTGDGRPDLLVGARGLLQGGALLVFPGASLKAPPTAGSCMDSCGGIGDTYTCWCDPICEKYGDCCADRDEFCPGGKYPAATCDGSCGGASPQGCWCDDLCKKYGDCCADYLGFCEAPHCSIVTGSCDVTLENGWDSCACDADCAQRGDCCDDAGSCG